MEYQKGYDEGRRGNHSPTNPYVVNSPEHIEFERGVKDGWLHYCSMMQSGG